MITLTNEKVIFFEEMALRNESAAMKAATYKQYFRYSRMQYRYKLLQCREMLRLANKQGRDARSLVMRAQAMAAGCYKRYDRLYQEVCHATHP